MKPSETFHTKRRISATNLRLAGEGDQDIWSVDVKLTEIRFSKILLSIKYYSLAEFILLNQSCDTSRTAEVGYKGRIVHIKICDRHYRQIGGDVFVTNSKSNSS